MRLLTTLSLVILSLLSAFGPVQEKKIDKESSSIVVVKLPYSTVCHLLEELYPAGKRRKLVSTAVPQWMTLYEVAHEKEDERFVLQMDLARTVARTYKELAKQGLEYIVRRVRLVVARHAEEEQVRLTVEIKERSYNGLGIRTSFTRTVDAAAMMEDVAGWLVFQARVFGEPR